MYKDIELKLNYHKEKIIQSFIKRGIYPNHKMIESLLNDIELRLAIFKRPVVSPGECFNASEFNIAINKIYSDLSILYSLLEEVSKNEFLRLKYYMDSHLRELEQTADSYLKKAELESYTTALGKTTFFKANDFEVDYKTNSSVIHLGEVSLENSSKLACITSIDNAKYEDVVFTIKNDNNKVMCNAYNYNHDTVTMPGKRITNVYEYNIPSTQKVNGPLELGVKVKDKDKKSSYITLAGKDKILYKHANTNGEVLEEKPIAINSLSFAGHAYIDFYVVGGSSINFRFNKKPLSTNFNINANRIDNLDYIHHFFIECDEGFSFEFELDKGSVYAIKEKTIINQDKFFYSGDVEANDFLVVQTLAGESRKYDIDLNIYNANISADDIKSVMIKQVE